MQTIKASEGQGRRPPRILGGTERNQRGVRLVALGAKFGRRVGPGMADRLDFQQLSFGLRRMSWIRFWIQVALGIVVFVVLMLTTISGSIFRNADRAIGLGTGISLTTLAFLVLLFSLWQGWLTVRTGRAIDSSARPSRGETARLIKRGLLVDLSGLILAVIGYQALMGPLFIQAAQQTGIAIGGPGLSDNLPITSLEILSVLGNTQVLSAHLVGLLFSLWMLQRIYRTK